MEVIETNQIEFLIRDAVNGNVVGKLFARNGKVQCLIDQPDLVYLEREVEDLANQAVGYGSLPNAPEGTIATMRYELNPANDLRQIAEYVATEGDWEDIYIDLRRK